MDLKPCPFCAGTAYYWWGRSKYGFYAQVKCDDCHASTKLISINDDDDKHADAFYKTKKTNDDFWDCFDDIYPYKKAAELWNQRKRKRR